ncbi:MAG: hypothetical protein KIT81_05980 [Alphaproteobacteria bacterium]|nr:hypothetical protein [Alphaproteobacteria bacterium]MCW5750678.1 hypothetical protein [Alphaproteobacteria bacterium]
MSRSLTFFAVALTAAVSWGLYHLAYEVQRLEDELIDYNRALLRDREAMQVLAAEWSYLTRPEALQERALRHLDMRPLLPVQIARIEHIPFAETLAPAGAVLSSGDIPLPRPRPRPLPFAATREAAYPNSQAAPRAGTPLPSSPVAPAPPFLQSAAPVPALAAARSAP